MKILALVLAGGNGTRLYPLTAEHAKPALPFAQGYRIVDFVLSNLVNSDISRIYVLAQYKPQSLVAHIRTVWGPWSGGARSAVNVVLPEAGGESKAYKGTADAVYQNLHLIDREQPDLVAVFAADHVYRMDVRQMARSHRVFAYDFASNWVPGISAHEERGYWRNIGTVDAYRAAQRDVLGPLPRFSLVNPEWPIFGDACRIPRRMASLASSRQEYPVF